MTYLTVGRKLALLASLFMIPFATVTYMMVSSIDSEKVEFAKLELNGTRYDAPLSVLLRDLEEHDSAAACWLRGDASFQDVVERKARDIALDVDDVTDVDRLLDSSLHTGAEWSQLREAITTLLRETPGLAADESLDRHHKLIDATVLLISHVSDNSKLTLDPDIDTYYLMNLVMFQGPATSEFLSQAGSLHSRAAASESLAPEQADELVRLSVLADFSQEGIADSLHRAMAFNETLTPELSASAQASAAGIAAMTASFRNPRGARPPDATARAEDDALSGSLNLLFAFENDATASLNRLLNIRLAHWRNEVRWTLGIALLGLSAVLVIGCFVARDITVPLQGLAGIARQIASGTGNYSVRVNKRRDDELGVLIDAFNEMLKQIQERDEALEKRVADRTEEVVTSLALVNATLESTTDGILVTDAEGNPASFNKKFLEMWKIPGQGDDARARSKSRAMTSTLGRDYALFLSRVKELQANPDEETFEQMQLKDGRLFEQYSKPQRVDDRCVGRVWSFRDITERKRAEKEMELMHQQLLDTSRQAGMAEVATSVLHNVGNVLNSVNVSCSVVATLIKKSKVENLGRIVELLAGHAADIGSFLTLDPKGSQLPVYLGQLSRHLTQQHGTALRELDRLQENIDHIKDIVMMQQGYAKVSGVVENLTMTSLLEDALRLNLCSLQRHGVEVVRDYDEVLPMETERHKILQILVNLICNAKHACDECPRADSRITLRVAACGDRIRVSVTDNGVGIPAENLKRIFGHGFTTKKAGHGFGLHSAALAAKEMGGSLEVESAGLGKGTTFTLDLPYRRATDATVAVKTADKLPASLVESLA
jgi:PAS domain S-box-containing protein